MSNFSDMFLREKAKDVTIGTPSRFALYIIDRNHTAAHNLPEHQYQTYDELAATMGLSHDRVRKACAPLVKAGLITIEYRRNKGPALIRLVVE